MKDIHDNSRLSHAEHEAEGKGRTYRQRIVSLLMTTQKSSMTDREIMAVLQVIDVNNIRPEITRLKQAGVIRESGKIKCPVTGKTVRTVCIQTEFCET
ncbi:hypothetical protein LCGC14_0619200, partial [marine sediment metagenome]